MGFRIEPDAKPVLAKVFGDDAVSDSKLSAKGIQSAGLTTDFVRRFSTKNVISSGQAQSLLEAADATRTPGRGRHAESGPLLARASALLANRVAVTERRLAPFVEMIHQNGWISVETIAAIENARRGFAAGDIAHEDATRSIAQALQNDPGVSSLGDDAISGGRPDVSGVTNAILGRANLSVVSVLLTESKAGFLNAAAERAAEGAGRESWRVMEDLRIIGGTATYLDNLKAYDRFSHYTSRAEVMADIDTAEAETIETILGFFDPITMDELHGFVSAYRNTSASRDRSNRAHGLKMIASELTMRLLEIGNEGVTSELLRDGEDQLRWHVEHSLLDSFLITRDTDYEIARSVAALFLNSGQIGAKLNGAVGETETLRSFIRDFIPNDID